VSAPVSVGNPFGFAKVPSRQALSCETQPPTPVAEEYQIAFLSDNFFLPGIATEITLASVPMGDDI
jgi:hypothetical protein